MSHPRLRAIVAPALLATACVAPAKAAVQFNELLFDAPSTNVGKRFFEFRSTTGGAETLNDVTLVAIDGDGGAAGAIDFALSLGSISTGTNGLALLRDSTSQAILPAPEPETTVLGVDYTYNENTTVTYLLVTGFTGTAGTGGTDVDTDNNGTLDSTPWSSVLDAVSFRDATSDRVYAALLGGLAFEESDAPFNGTDIGGFLRDQDGNGHAFRVTGDTFGPYTVTESDTLPIGYAITPGSANPAIPEPASLALLGVAGLLTTSRRRAATR